MVHKHIYRISGIFRMGLIFTEFATSLKSPKIDTAKNKPYDKSQLRTPEIAKIGLGENSTHLPGVIFAKFTRREKIPIYGSNIIVYQKYIGTSIKVDCATRSLYASSVPKAEGVPTSNQRGRGSGPCRL